MLNTNRTNGTFGQRTGCREQARSDTPIVWQLLKARQGPNCQVKPRLKPLILNNEWKAKFLKNKNNTHF